MENLLYIDQQISVSCDLCIIYGSNVFKSVDTAYWWLLNYLWTSTRFSGLYVCCLSILLFNVLNMFFLCVNFFTVRMYHYVLITLYVCKDVTLTYVRIYMKCKCTNWNIWMAQKQMFGICILSAYWTRKL